MMRVSEAEKYLEHYSAGPLTYTAESGYSICRDLAATEMGGDAEASRRLQAHALECARHPAYAEQRTSLNATVGTGGSLIAPDYLVPMFAEAVIAAAPLIATIPHYTLTRTDIIYLPAITAAPTAAVQSSQNSNASDTSLTDAFLSSPVASVASAQIMSRQLAEQSPIGLDEWILPTLGDAVGAVANTQCWSGTGSSNQFTGIDNWSGVQTIHGSGYNSFGDAVAVASNLVWANRLRRPTHIFMAPATWNWLCLQHDGQQRPYSLPHPGRPNVATDAYAGMWLGLNVVLDTTVTANTAYVLRAQDLAWFSRGPALNVFQQTYASQLSVFVSALLYGAFIVKFPSAVVRIDQLTDTVPGS